VRLIRDNKRLTHVHDMHFSVSICWMTVLSVGHRLSVLYDNSRHVQITNISSRF